MTQRTLQQLHQEIAAIEDDLAALSDMRGRIRILAARLRNPSDLTELAGLLSATERMHQRAIERRTQAKAAVKAALQPTARRA